MQAFRIADTRFPIFDGSGAKLLGGRWNSPGRAVIYTAETFAGALLEILVHANLGRIPRTHGLIEMQIPSAVAVELVDPDRVPRWDAPDFLSSRMFGDKWLAETRSAVLSVPSAETGGRERNLIINPAHADFSKIVATGPYRIRWDERLFRTGPLPARSKVRQ